MQKKHIVALAGTAILLIGGAVVAHNSPAQQILPNSDLTPGITNPSVTQSNISQTICNPNWSTKSIRPPSSYTSQLKVKQIKEYGYQDIVPSHYEEDHLVSLELGGSPTDPKNLWPESYNTKPNAKDKDSVENYLHKQICNGTITLQEAQKEISNNWVAVYKQMKGVVGAIDVTNYSDD